MRLSDRGSPHALHRVDCPAARALLPFAAGSYFCTLGHQAGTYTVGVVAGNMGGFGAELLTSAAEIAIDSGVPRMGRGRYRLHVRHAIFADGLMSPEGGRHGAPDVRRGCVGYTQTRNYTLQSSGVGDSNLCARSEASASVPARVRVRVVRVRARVRARAGMQPLTRIRGCAGA